MRIFDAHHHIRMGDMMGNIISEIEGIYSYVLVMPNVPRLDNPKVIDYHLEQMKERGAGSKGTQYLLTQYLCPGMKISDKIVGVKVYPEGVTTGSLGSGITDLRSLDRELKEIEERDLILMIHAEEPGAPDWIAEEVWLQKHGEWLLKTYPKLRVIIEHLSSEFAANWIENYQDERLAATVTLHHLYETWESGLVCCPRIKKESDRQALWEAIESDWCFFGSDSAGHTVLAKKAGAKGIYVPGNVAVSLLVDLNPDFYWARGINFYRLPDKGIIVDVKEENWKVPNVMHNMTPFMNGQTLDYVIDRS